MSKHTPGPWTATDYNDATKDHDDYYIFIEPNVAVIEKKVQGESDWDDARLIAAAPELLEAVTELLKWFPTDSELVEAGWSFTDIETAMNAHEKARAAIAKATGEK